MNGGASDERLDILVARLLGTSREEARRLIKNGYAQVAGRMVTKPGIKLHADCDIRVNRDGLRKYASQGGDKLEAALAYFQVNIAGTVCLDVGASTGGFTDCMLRHEAKRVFAVENGTKQMLPSLRDDPRVVLLEQTDIRTLTPEVLGVRADFAAVDVSFISLTKVLGAVTGLLMPGARLVCLVKPQFEAGPGLVNRHGVVRSEAVRKRAVEVVSAYAKELGLTSRGVMESPVATANKEYLCCFIFSDRRE